MTKRFDIVGPTEEAILTFEMAEGLSTGESLTGTPVVAVEVDRGTDANPNAIVIHKTIVGTDVLVAVANMTQGVDYHITVTCPTTNDYKTLALAGILPVRKL